ncbi:MAG: ABC transporter permease [Desulfobulbaceae bacterium]|nr:ABC transporter permease [Desulfobulbaceae bacterium]
MRLFDTMAYSFHALFYVRLRAFLMLLAMAIGVASVVVLVSLGEAARNYVVSRFASLGTNLLIVIPGRMETTGGIPPLLGAVPRDLTIGDARALLRAQIFTDMAPIVVGNAPVSHEEREREVAVLGTTPSFLKIRHLAMNQGRFLPDIDPYKAQQVCILGATIVEELFGKKSPLGRIVRIGDSRFRVIGILGQAGISIGVDLDDLAVIPVASAQALFNTESLFRIIMEAKDRDSIPRAKQEISRIIRERHEGEEDVTVITQDAVLSTFDRIFDALTLTVSAIAAISLLVAGILVMNVMLISVSQRTSEIGLLKALGAPSRQILQLFMAEAMLLSILGGLIGIIVGGLANESLQRAFPDFTLIPPLWAIGAAFFVAIATGLFFSFLPARRAARMEAVEALSRH